MPFFLVVFLLGTLSPAQGAEPVKISGVQLVQDEKKFSAESSHLPFYGSKLSEFVASCNFSDKSHPKLLKPTVTAEAFKETKKQNHLRFLLAEPAKVTAISGPVQFNSLVASLDPNGPGAHVFTAKNFTDNVIRHSKCNGLVFGEILCHGGLKAHLSDDLKHYCLIYGKKKEEHEG